MSRNDFRISRYGTRADRAEGPSARRTERPTGRRPECPRCNNEEALFPANFFLAIVRRTESDIINLEPDNLWMLGALVAFTFVVNLPFGFMRAGTKRYSLGWILCIHLPVPLIFLLRKFLMFSAAVIPALVVAAIAGQILGGRIRNIRRGWSPPAGVPDQQGASSPESGD